nr:hypothetical protein [Tanacetum cinerariifolium]
MSGDDVVDLTGNEDPTDEDGDTGMSDLTGVSVSLGGEIFSEEKKSQESNISGSDNTRDRGKTAGRAIIAWGGGISSYACMIYGSLCDIGWGTNVSVESVRFPFLGKRGDAGDDLNGGVGSAIYKGERPLGTKKTWRLRLGSVDRGLTFATKEAEAFRQPSVLTYQKFAMFFLIAICYAYLESSLLHGVLPLYEHFNKAGKPLPCSDKMAEENIPALIRSDDQLVPIKARLPYGKSNLLLELLWEEFVQAIQTFFTHRDNLNIPTKKSTPHVIPYCQFTKLIVYYLGSRHNIHRRPVSSIHITRVPYDQRNNPPQHPRIVYPPILDINHFRHFLVTLENLYPMDNEPMWVADRVVAPTPGSTITIPETANEFAIDI